MRQGVTQNVARRAARGHSSQILRWIVGFGGVGLFVVSVVDASIIPLPIPGSTDLLLLVLVARRANALLMAIAATTGSIVGGYLTWKTGAAGGEAAVHRYVPKWIVARLSSWVEAPWLPCRCGSGAAPSAGAASPILALRRRVGSAAAQIPALFYRGQERSLRSDCMAGNDLWAQDRARLGALSYKLGRYHHLGLCRAVGGWDLIRNLEMAPDAP